MPYLYSDEQRQIREEVRRVLASTDGAATLRGLLEQSGAHDAAFWSSAREMGWTAMSVAEADGGLGLSPIDTLIVAEECGRALSGAPFLATGFAAAHVLSVTGASQALQAIASGDSIAVLAFGEGSEALPHTPETRFAGGQLTGRKTAVLGGATADLAIVLAVDEDSSLCLVQVNLGAQGVAREVLTTIDNSRCVATLTFDGAQAARLVSDDALAMARAALGRLALFLASEGVGGTDVCIGLASDYANQRQAFGQAIGKFQAVKHGIAEMYVLNEMARASVLDAAVRLVSGDDDVEAYIGAARLNAIQAYETAAAGVTQIHGGIGVTWEADLHLHYRRSRSLATEAGSVFYWEDRVVAMLEAA